MKKETLWTLLVIDGIIFLGFSGLLIQREWPHWFPKTSNSVNRQVVQGTGQRKILFQYRDSRPQSVEITGDFNGWEPEPMTRDESDNWKSIFYLKPGEYLYNFIVDGRWIKDPYNPNSKENALGKESSVKVVKKLEEKE